MRFLPILIVALSMASFADAGPFRRAPNCAGGSCSVAPVAYAAPEPARPFNPRDLVMSPTKDHVKEQITELQNYVISAPTACSGGQCSTSPANRFGRVNLRVFRR